MRRRAEALLLAASMIMLVSIAGGCGSDSGGGGTPAAPARPAVVEGTAILDVKLVNAPLVIGTQPTPPAIEGYTLLDMDLNDSTGGDYIWLYGKVGPADGSEGTPLGEVYTVDKTDGETLKSEGDTQLGINLTTNSIGVGDEIYLAFRHAAWPVVRGIAVANVDYAKGTEVIKYIPPEVKGIYPVYWVQQRPSTPLPRNGEPGHFGYYPQDLNEGTSTIIPPHMTDYIYIGYCLDQDYYDWLSTQDP
jgi:hypothetical protein